MAPIVFHFNYYFLQKKYTQCRKKIVFFYIHSKWNVYFSLFTSNIAILNACAFYSDDIINIFSFGVTKIKKKKKYNLN